MTTWPATAKHRRQQPEYDAQVLLFVLIDWLMQLHPDRAGDLEDVWATPSGGKRPAGEAGRMKASGQRKGVPDVECAVPAHGHPGLFIEMKSPTGRLTPEQRDRMARLNARGYQTAVCRSWPEAGHLLCDYLDLPWPRDAETQVEARLCLQRATPRGVTWWPRLPVTSHPQTHAGETP
ncbi:MAG TPA: VRR-NUC domain-containing protein [Rhodanobacteraceae bacterium]